MPPGKAKKKGAAAASARPKVERKEYPLAGQKRDTPEEGESLRKFYTSLRKQKPESEMAEVWLMEHGLLPEDEAEKAYKRMLIRKGRSAPAKKSSSGGSRPSSAGKSSSSRGGKSKTPPGKKSSAASSSAKKKLKPGVKRKAAVIDDDDSDEDIPLATFKSNGGGGGFKIPKKQGGSTPSKAEKAAAREGVGA